MNEIITTAGLQSLKPLVSALLVPPVPFLFLLILGWLLLWRRRRGAGLPITAVAAIGIWFSGSSGLADVIEAAWLRPPPPLSVTDIAALRRQVGLGRRVGVMVLGGGRRLQSPDYQRSTLKHYSLERLQYGIWLSRQIGAPLGYSGGVSHGARAGPTEAEIAAWVADKEFQRPLRWTESLSRDTRENAAMTVTLLQGERLDDLIVVTHRWHMPRAMAMFQWAVSRQGSSVRLHAAPAGGGSSLDRGYMRWMPTPEGFARQHQVWHELIGLWSGV